MTAVKIPDHNPYLRRKLPRWDWLQLVFLLLLYLVLFYLYGTGLKLLYRVVTPAAGPGEVRVRIDDGAWYFVGIILSLGTAGVALKFVYQGYLRLKYRSFLNRGFRDHTIRGYGIIKALAWLMMAAAAFFLVHLYDSLIVVKEQRITINGFLQFGKRNYELKDITFLHCVPEYGRKSYATDTNYRIGFRDAYVFDSRDHMLEDCRGLILHLSEKTGLPVDTVGRWINR